MRLASLRQEGVMCLPAFERQRRGHRGRTGVVAERRAIDTVLPRRDGRGPRAVTGGARAVTGGATRRDGGARRRTGGADVAREDPMWRTRAHSRRRHDSRSSAAPISARWLSPCGRLPMTERSSVSIVSGRTPTSLAARRVLPSAHAPRPCGPHGAGLRRPRTSTRRKPPPVRPHALR